MAKNGPKTEVFWPKIAFLDFPGRVLSNQGRGFPFGENPKNPKIPTQIPKYFGPVLTSWLDLVAARRSGSKKAARGCPRIQIWSHEGPNQSQNHVSGRSWCHPVCHPGRPVNHGFSHPASRKARVASGLEPRHVLRKQTVLFFFRQKHTLWKNGMPNR